MADNLLEVLKQMHKPPKSLSQLDLLHVKAVMLEVAYGPIGGNWRAVLYKEDKRLSKRVKEFENNFKSLGVSLEVDLDSDDLQLRLKLANKCSATLRLQVPGEDSGEESEFRLTGVHRRHPAPKEWGKLLRELDERKLVLRIGDEVRFPSHALTEAHHPFYKEFQDHLARIKLR